ncbi:phosphoglucosamine mutase [bacterium]|nr:phosphoglucosamine mutase [bacterium]PIV81021.1 MAG: phosphoglucosamine mutase [bacterium CG17_big_fil_post_rev_8_21_14_2_50_64_8]
MPLQISISGIRGVIGDGLDAVTVARWASAFGAWLPPGPVVVGRDTRLSGPMVFAAVAAALSSTGHDVRDIGIATTPTTEIAVQESDAVGGVIITASHNPGQWNALKFLQGSGLFLTRDHNREVRERYENGAGHVGYRDLGVVSKREGADDQHLAAIAALPWLDTAAIAARRLHAVVDAVEGAGGDIVPRLLERLQVRCTALNCGLSGEFPHDPEPTPAHLEDLCRKVAEEGADIGFAVDPDVDRLALVDEKGRALSEEMTLVLAVDFLLGKMRSAGRSPGPVAVNLSTTGLIETVAARHGVVVYRTPVGEANVVEAILDRECELGGEGNGGVIYPALHAGRDALVGIAMVLQAVAESDGSLADMAAALPPVVMQKAKVDADQLPGGEDLKRALAALGPGTFDERDGLKWVGVGAWVHVRPSNTEPVVRIIAEAQDEQSVADLIRKVRQAV